MNDFDFLRDHGYGVVYGEKAVRQKIIDLAIKSPEGKNMTYEQATADLAVTPVEMAEAAVERRTVFSGIDADGNPIEVTEEVGYVTDEGVVAAPADVTLH